MINTMEGWLTYRMRRQGGFTLIELIIVVAIVGLLAAVAYPSYTNFVGKSNRGVARAALVDIVARQESYYGQTKTYASNLSQLGFPSAQIWLKNDGGLIPKSGSNAPADATYLLSIATTPAPGVRGFTAQAELVPGFFKDNDSECGTLTIDAQDNRSSSEGGADCW